MVIGAPKANTTQANVKQGGSVFYCPWSLSQSDCFDIEFDPTGKCSGKDTEKDSPQTLVGKTKLMNAFLTH